MVRLDSAQHNTHAWVHKLLAPDNKLQAAQTATAPITALLLQYRCRDVHVVARCFGFRGNKAHLAPDAVHGT